MDDLSPEYTEPWAEFARLRLKQLRAERGWTYEQLEQASGVKKPTASGIENGHQRVSVDTLYKLAQAYEVSADEILGLHRIGTPVAPSLPRVSTQPGGIVDLPDRVNGRIVISVSSDMPELRLSAGDLMELDPSLPPAPGKLVAVREPGGDSRLYRVRSIGPTILDREGGPAVLLEGGRGLTYQGRLVGMWRADP